MTGVLWELFPFLFWAVLLRPGTFRTLTDEDTDHDHRPA